MLATFVTFIIATHFCSSQNFGTVVYIPRIRNAITACPTTDSFFILNVTATPYRNFEYWNGYGIVSEDFLIDKLIYSAQKCGEGFFPCEKFINITTSGRDIVQFAKTKGQLWSPFWEAIHPKPNLPMVRKNTYNITNATLDVRAIKAMVPEAEKHCWKIRVDIFTKSFAKHACFDVDVYVIKHTIQRRVYVFKVTHTGTYPLPYLSVITINGSSTPYITSELWSRHSCISSKSDTRISQTLLDASNGRSLKIRRETFLLTIFISMWLNI